MPVSSPFRNESRAGWIGLISSHNHRSARETRIVCQRDLYLTFWTLNLLSIGFGFTSVCLLNVQTPWFDLGARAVHASSPRSSFRSLWWVHADFTSGSVHVYKQSSWARDCKCMLLLNFCIIKLDTEGNSLSKWCMLYKHGVLFHR